MGIHVATNAAAISVTPRHSVVGLSGPDLPRTPSVASNPLQCAEFGNTMRFIALIEEPLVIEKILRHLHLWCGPAQFAPARPPTFEGTTSASFPAHGPARPQPATATSDAEFRIETDPMPDYDSVITD